MTKLTGLVLAAALLAPPLAFANTVATGGGEAHRSADPPWGGSQRLEGRLGMLIGGSDVGDADGFALGVSAGVGYRVGDVTLRGLFDYYRIGDGGNEAQDRRGRSTRVGGALRYSFARAGDGERGGPSVDFWGEAGLGWEHAAWRRGGVLDRPSGELAVGFEIDAQGPERSPGRRRHIGYFMAFRTLFGEGPAMAGPPVCGGPCTKATKPSRLDTSMFFELGIHWGR